MGKNKYSALCCYFGTWPSHFQFWLDSCSHNEVITFILITDIPIDEYEVPQNVKIIKNSFADIQAKVKSKFPALKVSLNTPYKLCCFKAAYGYIFEDIFKDFEYWGFYDIDTIWGDICRFIPENENNYFIKIFPCGHLTFIRNDEVNCKAYKLVNEMIDSEVLPQIYKGHRIHHYEYVFTHPECFYFDELGGLEPLYKLYGDVYYGVADFADLYPGKPDFREIRNNTKTYIYRHTKEGQLFHIYRSGFKIKEEQISYLHASKRRLKICAERSADFFICPNKIISNRKVTFFSFLYLSVNWSVSQNFYYIIRIAKKGLRKFIRI